MSDPAIGLRGDKLIHHTVHVQHAKDMFRFLVVFPPLTTSESYTSSVREYSAEAGCESKKQGGHVIQHSGHQGISLRDRLAPLLTGAFFSS